MKYLHTLAMPCREAGQRDASVAQDVRIGRARVGLVRDTTKQNPPGGTPWDSASLPTIGRCRPSASCSPRDWTPMTIRGSPL